MKPIEKKCEELAGTFYRGDIEITPYNHWKSDCEWMVMIVHLKKWQCVFLHIEARTTEEAISQALDKYLLHGEDE